MNKYLNVLQLSWQNGFVYRTSLILWRLRNFLGSFMALTVWSVLFANQPEILNYSQSQMLSYIFLVASLQSIILSTILHGLAGEIYSGNISKILLQPIRPFLYYLSIDIADKLKNFGFAIIELIALFLIFQPELSIPSLIYGLLFLLSLILAILLYFFVMLIFACFGFYSPETWGPRFLFFMFLDFTAGKMFPLDILPKFIQNMIAITPFPYLSYYQIQIYLERLTVTESLQRIGILALWCLTLGSFFNYLWRKGIRDYSAAGQ